MQKRTTRHAQKDRYDRFSAIIDAVQDIGKPYISIESVRRGGTDVITTTLTDNGVIYVMVKDTQKIITVYLAGLNQMMSMYRKHVKNPHAKLPNSLYALVKRNIELSKKYPALGNVQEY